VRELRNAIERALVLSPEGTLRAEELGMRQEAVKIDGGLPFPATLAVLNRAAVGAMLELTKGNKSEAARRLGISRPRLQRLLDGTDDAN
jgi:two-component system response regulator HydG